MITKKECPYCQGSGIIVVQTSSLFGLFKKETSTTCQNCQGKGQVVETPMCKSCEGRGLVGNEREICRTCNGTGRADSFSFVPRSKIKKGLVFERRCDLCKANAFEIDSEIADWTVCSDCAARWSSHPRRRESRRTAVRNHSVLRPLLSSRPP